MILKPPDFGLEVVAGLMGSGKSYWATWRLLKVLREDRRPVFTNLPLRWRVLRKYLATRHGPEVAQLVYQLTEHHWRNFLRRQRERAEFRDRFKVVREGHSLPLTDHHLSVLVEHGTKTDSPTTPERVRRQTRLSTKQLDALWYDYAGPDIYNGDDANWIPACALIVIDEVQHWHPMHSQKDETNDLQAYLTMLRHHVHWVWVMTQEAGRINVLFRKLGQQFWHVRNRAEDTFAWGIKWKHLRLFAFGYDRYTSETWEHRDRPGVEPIERYTLWPQLPANRIIFRLYDSFTNIGSLRSLIKAMKAVRSDSGLEETGKTRFELEAEKPQPTQATKEDPNMIRAAVRKLSRVAALVLVALVAGFIGAMAGGGGTEEVAPVPVAETAPAAIEWGQWAATSPGVMYVEGEAYRPGTFMPNGAHVRAISPDGRRVVLTLDGVVWLWEYGDSGPRTLGEEREVFDRVRLALADKQRDGRP